MTIQQPQYSIKNHPAPAQHYLHNYDTVRLDFAPTTGFFDFLQLNITNANQQNAHAAKESSSMVQIMLPDSQELLPLQPSEQQQPQQINSMTSYYSSSSDDSQPSYGLAPSPSSTDFLIPNIPSRPNSIITTTTQACHSFASSQQKQLPPSLNNSQPQLLSVLMPQQPQYNVSSRQQLQQRQLAATADRATRTKGPFSQRGAPNIAHKRDHKSPLNTEWKRQVHIQSEQKRRAQIKDGFEELRNELPSCLNKKMSKVALLHRTVQHIQHLKNTQNAILVELERLVQENDQLRRFHNSILQSTRQQQQRHFMKAE